MTRGLCQKERGGKGVETEAFVLDVSPRAASRSLGKRTETVRPGLCGRAHLVTRNGHCPGPEAEKRSCGCHRVTRQGSLTHVSVRDVCLLLSVADKDGGGTWLISCVGILVSHERNLHTQDIRLCFQRQGQLSSSMCAEANGWTMMTLASCDSARAAHGFRDMGFREHRPAVPSSSLFDLFSLQ